MLEMSDAYVARVAEQASDISRVAAVIDVKNAAASPFRIIRLANRAAAILFCKQFVIGSIGDTEAMFQLVVAFLTGILPIPLAVVRSVRSGIRSVAFPYFRDAARLAVILQAVVRGFVFIELRAKLYLFAGRASLMGFRVAFELGHQMASYLLNHLRPEVGLTQGEI